MISSEDHTIIQTQKIEVISYPNLIDLHKFTTLRIDKSKLQELDKNHLKFKWH